MTASPMPERLSEEQIDALLAREEQQRTRPQSLALDLAMALRQVRGDLDWANMLMTEVSEIMDELQAERDAARAQVRALREALKAIAGESVGPPVEAPTYALEHYVSALEDIHEAARAALAASGEEAK